MNRAVEEGEPRMLPGAGRATVRALVIDGDRGFRQAFSLQLEGLGCDVEQVASGAAALAAIRREPFALAICELELGQESGLDLLPHLLAGRPGLEVVMVTAHVSCQTAVEAMRRGAKDYLEKPLAASQVHRLVDEALERTLLERRETGAEYASTPPLLETSSPRMRSALALLERAAARDWRVLLRGEAGTGKGLLARALHARSRRRDLPFTVVSCRAPSQQGLESELFGHAKGAFQGALCDREGAIEAARGGTVFIDELANLSPRLQLKLLHFLRDHQLERAGELQTRTASARIVAATAQDLPAESKAGRFREDLLYLLEATQITVPPLRERIEDIVPLAQSFAAGFSQRTRGARSRLPLDTRKMLVAWSWPGNVRELRDVVERALAAFPGGDLVPEALPARFALQPAGAPLPGGLYTVEEIEREHALRVLAWAGSLGEAARILGISTDTLNRRRKKWFGGGDRDD